MLAGNRVWTLSRCGLSGGPMKARGRAYRAAGMGQYVICPCSLLWTDFVVGIEAANRLVNHTLNSQPGNASPGLEAPPVGCHVGIRPPPTPLPTTRPALLDRPHICRSSVRGGCSSSLTRPPRLEQHSGSFWVEMYGRSERYY